MKSDYEEVVEDHRQNWIQKKVDGEKLLMMLVIGALMFIGSDLFF